MTRSLTAQSKSRCCRFPGSFVAARELGVHRDHLHKVLTGKRESKSLRDRWNAWLQANPEFLKANQAKNPETSNQAANPTV